MHKNNHNKENGLTMIELTVAVGIFGLIISMVSAIFVLSLQSQRRISAFQNIQDNSRFILESMSREIRTGKNFTSASGSLSFTNAKGESVIYRLNNNTVEKSSNGGITYLSITGSEVNIDYLNFYLMGQPAGDRLQPRITITIGVTSSVGNKSANLKNQITISERSLQS